MLTGLKVVEAGGTVAAGSAGDMFQRLGAEVTRLDLGPPPPSSSSTDLRARLIELLARGKRVVPSHGLWEEAAVRAMSAADLVVVDVSGLRQDDGALVPSDYNERVAGCNPGGWVTISPFGLYGERRDLVASEITYAASGGVTRHLRSVAGRPMKPAGFTSSITAGHFAVLAALHAWLLRTETGTPVHLDLSIQDSVVSSGVFLECSHELFECAGSAGSSRHGPPSGLIQCSSGLMWLMVVEDHQWKAFVQALGHPSWAEGIESVKDRERNADVLAEGTSQWALQYSNREAVARLQAAGVPATAVNSCSDLADASCPDIRPGFFIDSGKGERLPGLPFSTLGPRRPEGRAPTAEEASARPRVIDMTNVLVGPLACSWLGAMGVDVLKVEDPGRLDVYRRRGPFPGGVADIESGAYFASANYCKRSYALALDTAEGSQRLADLMASADVVITNLSAHRATKLGVVPSALDSYSGTVLISSGGFSQLAENATHRCYGYNCHASGGLVDLSRDREGNPRNLLTAWADPLTSIWIAVLATAQILQPPAKREHINLSMTEVVAFEFPEFFSRLTRDGVAETAHENRVSYAAPHGIFQCEGEDQWIAIACETEEQWQALLGILNRPPGLAQPHFGTMAERAGAQDLLDDALERETLARRRDGLFTALQEARVPSAPVLSARELVSDEHLRTRELFQTVVHPRWGRRALTGLPWRIAGSGPVRLTATPLLGADTVDHPSGWWTTTERKPDDVLH